MRLSRLVSYAVASLLLAEVPKAGAGSVAIGSTPILTAALPTNSTYSVESSSNGTSWNSTGILISGNGSNYTVRLDGFSNALSYRLSRVGSSGIVTPSMSDGFYLGSTFSGAGEIRFESAALLSAWAHHQFAFPDLAGSFTRALRPPFQTQAFFRAVQPAAPLVLATLASYFPNTNSTYSGFGIVADDMPQLYREGFIASACPAFYHRDGLNNASAGECYQFVGSFGTSTAMVADIAIPSPAGTCDIGRSYFDLGTPAFTNVFGVGGGYGTATYRLVPAPVVGNLKLVVAFYGGPSYFELRPYNYRAGINKLEIRHSGGGWTELPRATYNSFFHSGSGIAFPIEVRVTSRFGEVVQFPLIASMSAGSRFTASGQFAFFPDQGPMPVWILPAVYTEGLTNNILGGRWTTSQFGATVNPNYTGSAYQGSASFQISNFMGFGGVIFTHPTGFVRPADGMLEFAIRSNSGAITSLTMAIGGTSGFGNVVTLPTVDTTWRVFRIPLEPAQAPNWITQFRIFNAGGSAIADVLLDSIQFRQP